MSDPVQSVPPSAPAPTPSVVPAPVPTVSTVPPPAPSPTVTPTDLPSRLSDAEVQMLERQNNKRNLAKAIADKATSDAEVAELQYKNLIMQLFMQYGLTKSDSISQEGAIVRGNVNVNPTK